MKTEKIKIDDLTHYDLNEKIHTPENLALIEQSIKEIGYVNPIIVDEDNQILAGHGRAEVMKRMGNTEIDCIKLDQLTETQKTKFRLYDNQSSRTGKMDMDLITKSIESIIEDEEDFNIGILGVEGLAESFMDEVVAFDLGSKSVEQVQRISNEEVGFVFLTDDVVKRLNGAEIKFTRGLRKNDN